jgi:hypothetical protein
MTPRRWWLAALMVLSGLIGWQLARWPAAAAGGA